MKIISAIESSDGMITAVVRFEDGLDQTVTVPEWANKEQIRKEAMRLRQQVETKQSSNKARSDLIDE